MNDFVKMAQTITDAVSTVIPFAISLTDENGYIIGSTIKERIGKLHPDTSKILETNDYVAYDTEYAATMSNMYPGISTPLFFNGQFFGILGIIGQPEEVKPYVNLIKQYVEFIWKQHFLQEVKSLETQMEEMYLQYLLLGENQDIKKLIEYSHTLQINPEKPMICFIIEIDQLMASELESKQLALTGFNLRSFIIQKIKNYIKLSKEMKISFISTERVIVILPLETEAAYFNTKKCFHIQSNKLIHSLTDVLQKDVRIAVGSYIHHIRELKKSYEEAVFLLEHHQKAPLPGTVFSLANWDIASAILHKKLDQGLIDRMMFELKTFKEDSQYEELKITFLTYCDHHMNITQASKALFIHRNTLIYRLEKMENLLFIDMKNFKHCALLYIVLTAEKSV